MKPKSFSGLIILFASMLYIVPAQGQKRQEVSPTFVSGAANAEDLVRIPGTHLIIASNYSLGGEMSVISTTNRTVRRLQRIDRPAEKKRDNETRACSSAPSKIFSHGLAISSTSRGDMTLFVVNHGGRESVEIYSLALRDQNVTAHWKDCLLLPPGMIGNGVAILPDRSIVVAGNVSAVWNSSRGWQTIAGVSDAGGVELSKDFRWIYFSDWLGKRIYRRPVEGGPLESFRVDFLPDNIRLGDDGFIYLAGQDAAADRVEACAAPSVRTCGTPYVVGRIDPQRFTFMQLLRSPGYPEQFGAGTTALMIDGNVWVGTFRGSRISVYCIQDNGCADQSREHRHLGSPPISDNH